MFTQNFQNYMYNMFFGLKNANGSTGGLFGKNYIDIHGEEKRAYYSSDSSGYLSFGGAMLTPRVQNVGALGVYFGTDSTPATLQDYTLKNPITSGLTVAYKSVSVVKEEEGRYSVCGQYTMQNTSSEPIIIHEIGVVTSFYTSSSATASMLAERTVLGEPITIGPGKAKTVTYKLTFNQGQNV